MQKKITKVKPMQILLVDDDVVDQQIFAEALAMVSAPITLATASNIERLYSALAVPPLPNLIFLDINMPGINGMDGLRSLKKHTTYNQLPVIVYSVSDFKKDIEAAYATGAHYYMIKPYSVMNLRQSLKKIMTIDWHADPGMPPREHFIINEAFVLPSGRKSLKPVDKK